MDEECHIAAIEDSKKNTAVEPQGSNTHINTSLLCNRSSPTGTASSLHHGLLPLAQWAEHALVFFTFGW